MKGITIIMIAVLIAGFLYAEEAVVTRASKTYMLKASSTQPMEQVSKEYADIITRFQERNTSTANITGSRQIDTLYVDDGVLGGWGANGSQTWMEAVKIPVPQNNMSIIGLLYYPNNPAGGSPPLSWRVWDDGGAGGGPGALLLADTVVTPPYGSWYYIAVDPPVPIDSGYIFPGWSDDMMAGGALAIYNGYDSGLNMYNWWFNGSAWVIDDFFGGDFMIRVIVEIGGVPDTNDVGPVSIDITSPLPWNTTLPPQATVKNFGNVMETFDVTCEIDPGGYSSTETVTDLAAGDSIQVTFSPDFTFAMEDTYTVTVYTQLGSDMDTSNDTMMAYIETYDPGIAEDGSLPEVFSSSVSTISKGLVTIQFALPTATRVELTVYDVLGRMRETLVSDTYSAGTHSVDAELNVPAGVYFYRMETGLGINTNGKIILVD
jgi:hypothetical protein